MTHPPYDPDDDRADYGAQVVPLNAPRADRHPRPLGPTVSDGEATKVLEGEIVRVDSPEQDADGWLADLAARSKERRPIVPSWLRSRRQALSTLPWVCGHYAHIGAYHLTRIPKYAAKLTSRAPRGLVRMIGTTVRWVLDLEGVPVRMAAVHRQDADHYLKLSRQRDARVRLRVWLTGFATLALLVATAMVFTSSTEIQWATLAALTAALGLLGAPADRPLLDRAVVPTRVQRLTSDVVIRALGALGIAEINKALLVPWS